MSLRTFSLVTGLKPRSLGISRNPAYRDLTMWATASAVKHDGQGLSMAEAEDWHQLLVSTLMRNVVPDRGDVETFFS
jgi:hypothetical protein